METTIRRRVVPRQRNAWHALVMLNGRKIAVVLSGGGSKGAWQVGALRALNRRLPLKYVDIWTGVSVGAINAAAMAKRPDGLLHLERMWRALETRDVWQRSLTAWWRTGSLYSLEPLRTLLEDELGGPNPRYRRECLVGAVNLSTGKYESLPATIPAILASSAHPVFLAAQKIGQHWYTDGGIRNPSPFREAVARGAREIYAITLQTVDNEPAQPPKHRRLWGRTLREVEIVLNEAASEDFTLDEKLLRARNVLVGYNAVKLTVVRPTRPIQVPGVGLTFDPEVSARLIEDGDQVATEQLGPA